MLVGALGHPLAVALNLQEAALQDWASLLLRMQQEPS